jgi:hypothetical protein
VARHRRTPSAGVAGNAFLEKRSGARRI